MARKAQNSGPEPKRKAGGKPFPKGVSGNPGGRPKALKEVQALAAKFTRRAVLALARIVKESPNDKARIAAAEALLNRAWGKPSQAVEVSGPKGKPVETRTEVRHDDSPERLASILRAMAGAGVLPAGEAAEGAGEGPDAAVE